MRPATPRALVLAVLTLIYVANFIDRQLLPLLLQPIKTEYHVSDTQIGLLIGPTFALFYAVMGLPMGLIADRVSRRNLIGVSLAAFSAMTMLCGAGHRFWQLALTRMGVGIGEAGTGAPSQSMIADLYPGRGRMRAQAVYATGANIGVLVAFSAGGVLAERFGWRAAFLLAGIPGLLLCLALLAIREPARTGNPAAPALPVRHVLRLLATNGTYRLAVLGACTTCFTGYGVISFFPAFLIRSHGLDLHQVGLVIALMTGLGGALATLVAGQLADRLGARDRRWSLRIPALAAFLPIPLAPLCFLSSGLGGCLIGALPILALSAAFIGPVVATIQLLVPPGARATSVAVLILIDNLVGLGLGPPLVGTASDWLRPLLGPDALRMALLLAMVGSAVSVLCFLAAARRLGRPDPLAEGARP